MEIAILTRVNFILGMHKCNSTSSMEGFYSAEVFFAFLSLGFTVSEKCPFLFSVVVWQNDS